MANNNKHTGPNVPALRFPEFSGEWETFQLSDLASYSKERVKMETLYADNYVSTENMQQDFAGIKDAISLPSSGTAVEFQVGDILISNIRPYLKKIWLSDRNGGCSTDVLSLRTKNEKVDSAFLYCCLANDDFVSYVMSGAKGVKMPRGDKQHISSFNLGVPSVQEQRKIAGLISLLEKRISTQSKIIEEQETLLKSLADSSIEALCNGQWAMVPFSKLYERAGEGGTPSTSKREYYDNGDIPFIKIDDLKSKYITKHQDNISELGLKNSSAWIIPEDSVIYSNGATIGAVSINTYPISTKQGILGIVPKSMVYTEYLYYLMSSTFFAKEINRIVTEGTMKTAYLKDINKIRCPLPPIDTQIKIAKGLASISERLMIEKRILEQFKYQKRVLLSRMFI